MNVNVSLLVKRGWDNTKKYLLTITDRYSLEDTILKLKHNNYYKKLYGKAKNRTLIKTDPILYLSIYHHTSILEKTLISQKTWKGSYNFKYRIKFLVEYNCNIENLKCECGKKYTWTKFCRKCPSYHVTWKGKSHTNLTKNKQRLAAINYIKKIKGNVVPRYNINSIKFIEEYGKKCGYKFIHAENGGEYYIKELGYYVDAYDPVNNVVLEIDEKRHFDNDGQLKIRDINRQKEIEQLLNCKFIRIKI